MYLKLAPLTAAFRPAGRIYHRITVRYSTSSTMAPTGGANIPMSTRWRQTNKRTNKQKARKARAVTISQQVRGKRMFALLWVLCTVFVIMIRYYIITMSPWRHELTDCSLAQPQRKYCSTVAHEWMMTCVAGDCVFSSSQTWTYIDRLMRLPNVIWQRLLWQ